MLLDLKKLKRSGKDSHDFFFEYQPETELVDLPSANLTSVKINGTVTLTGAHSAYLEGEVAFTITGECTRCLKETTKEFVVEFNEAVEENNPDGYSLTNDTVDLTKIGANTAAAGIPKSKWLITGERTAVIRPTFQPYLYAPMSVKK
jgi:uncharacterized metal-binding protein YceD (DUF177 family)